MCISQGNLCNECLSWIEFSFRLCDRGQAAQANTTPRFGAPDPFLSIFEPPYAICDEGRKVAEHSCIPIWRVRTIYKADKVWLCDMCELDVMMGPDSALGVSVETELIIKDKFKRETTATDLVDEKDQITIAIPEISVIDIDNGYVSEHESQAVEVLASKTETAEKLVDAKESLTEAVDDATGLETGKPSRKMRHALLEQKFVYLEEQAKRTSLELTVLKNALLQLVRRL